MGENKMPCFHPLKAYVPIEQNANGKRPRTFTPPKGGYIGLDTLPCGQCIGCRLERSRQWAIRISQEASLYDENCFITLTYAPEHLPLDGSLDVRHYQLFMKRLRKHYGKKRIRFFHCGEYGERLGRPHYHACLLNFDFLDKFHHRNTDRGDPIYRSPTLERLWPFGLSEIGSVTFDSAAYVARYITKKITGVHAAAHYGSKFPEYTTMSRRPGIGQPWLDRYKTDVFPHDYVVLKSGKKVPVPRFYNQKFELENPELYAQIKQKRFSNQNPKFTSDEHHRNELEQSPERLNVKEIVQKATISTLTRKIEME